MKNNSILNLFKGYFIIGVFFLSTIEALQAQSIVGPISVDVGTTREYQVSGQATNVVWNVPVGATLISSNQTSADIRWDFVGSYSVWITFDEGSGFASLGVNVTGPPPATPPNPTISTNNCDRAILQRVGTPPPNVQWYWQGTNASGTSTNLGSGSTFTAPVGNNTNYYIRARSGGQWSTGSGSVAVTVVNLDPGVIGGTQTVCYNGNPGNLSATTGASGGSGGYTFQWQISNNGINGWTDINGATSSSYNPPGGQTVTRWYRRAVTSCGSITRFSNGVQVTVYPTLDPGSIVTSASPVCYGGNPTTLSNVSLASDGDGNYSYQWQYSDDNSNWNTISGATSTSYNPPGGLTATRWYRRLATSCSETKESNSVEVSVGPQLNIPDPPTVVNNCGNTVLTKGSSPNDITWYWQTTIGGTSTSNSNTSVTLTSGTTYYLRAKADTANCWSDAYVVTYTVNGVPTVAGGGNVSRCGTGTVNLTANPGTNANSIRWYDSLTGGSLLATGTNFTTPSISATTTYYAESYNDVTTCFASSRRAIEAQVMTSMVWYADTDGDGFGDPNSGQTVCAQPANHVQNSTDCDDTDPNINPDTIWYADLDGDGLGDPNSSLTQCDQPTDYVLDNTDICPTFPDPTNACTPTDPRSSDPQEHNYIYTRTYEDIVSGTIPFFQADDNLIQNISFFDGLGRPIQQNGIDQSPNKHDIVTHMEYDGLGRMEKEYLPDPDSDLPGNFRPLARSNTMSHYDTPKYQNTQNPYSEKEFENSPLNRVLKQAAPGNPWALIENADDHSIEFDYQANSSSEDQVKQFSVSLAYGDHTYTPTLVTRPDNGGEYDPQELTKMVTMDENHSSGKDHSTEEFQDKNGRVILKRTYDNEIPHDTYYVYDDFGNLSYVLPPKMNGAIANLDELGYQYVYDNRNRLVEKKIPRKGWEYIVYNKLDQPIMTQDANQRLDDEWLFTKYDAFGRVAYTGKAVDANDRVTVQGVVDNLTGDLWVSKSGSDNFGGTDIYYNNGAYPTGSLTEVLTINYYDDYNFDLNGIGLIVGNIYNRAVTTNVRGLATGSKVKVLETNDWITSITQFDDKGRPIYAVSKNDYLGTLDVTRMRIDFVGRTLMSRTEHTRNGNTVVTVDNFTYDHVGRLLAQTQCVGDETLVDNCNNSGGGGAPTDLTLTGTIDTDNVATNSIVVQPDAVISPENGGDDSTVLRIDPNATGGSGGAELIVLNSYDELGRLDNKKVGGDADATDVLNSAGLQTVDYDYNVRDWLTAINDVNNPGDDLFNFRIGYNEGANPLFNGNIALTQWKTLNTDTSIRTYDYTYDALNRIETATDNLGNYNLSGITYDKNGNIDGLSRIGNDGTAPTSTVYGVIDDLNYAYGPGNKLLSVTDAQTGALADQGFKDGNKTGNDYDYDANGNMIQDLNKGIPANGITYNHLNLPEQVSIAGGTISYVYDATGIKLKKTVSTGTETDYAGNYIYENGTLQFFSHAEGYVHLENGNYEYVYEYKDHLNNVRLSYTDADGNGSIDPTNEIIKESNYYPFGLSHKGYNNNVSPLGNSAAKKYMFGGKELDESLGLETYDFGARNYDPALGRWMNLDPLAEQMRRHSPYNYAFNNPLVFTDRDGMAPFTELFDSKGNKIGEDENGNDGNVSIVTNQTDADRIKKNTKKGELASQDDVNSGFKTTKSVLSESLNVLKRTEAKTANDSKGGLHGESSLVMKDGTVVEGASGQAAYIDSNNNLVANETLPDIPEGSTASDVEASIHSHVTGTIVKNNQVYSHDATSPSGADRTNFTNNALATGRGTNVIVGPLGQATGRSGINKSTGQSEVQVSQPGNGVVLYRGVSTTPSVILTVRQAKKIIR